MIFSFPLPSKGRGFKGLGAVIVVVAVSDHLRLSANDPNGTYFQGVKNCRGQGNLKQTKRCPYSLQPRLGLKTRTARTGSRWQELPVPRMIAARCAPFKSKS